MNLRKNHYFAPIAAAKRGLPTGMEMRRCRSAISWFVLNVNGRESRNDKTNIRCLCFSLVDWVYLLGTRPRGNVMNKRIKALALEAGWEPWEETSLWGKSDLDRTFQAGEYPVGEDLNKFAALIIQDCVACCAVVAQAAINARDGANDLYSHGREDAAAMCKSAIKRHFGEGK